MRVLDTRGRLIHFLSVNFCVDLLGHLLVFVSLRIFVGLLLFPSDGSFLILVLTVVFVTSALCCFSIVAHLSFYWWLDLKILFPLYL